MTATDLIDRWRHAPLLERWRALRTETNGRPGDTLLEVDSVSKRFGGVVAVREASLSVTRGQLMGLIGPNGAGKSTLVNLITKHQTPDSGRVLLEGRPIQWLSAYAVARAGLARTYQHNRLFWEDTVRENILTAMAWSRRAEAPEGISYPGASGTEEERLQALLGFFGLTAHEHDLPGSLTHFLRRKVEIAQALALAPKFLILDEPYAGLSTDESNELTTQLFECRSGGLSMLLIDHNMQVVMSVCEHLYVMHHGAMIASGTPAEVRANERVVNVYLAGEL